MTIDRRSHVIVVYAGEDPPATWQASIFVAGPMPRDPDLPSWRPELISELVAHWHHPGPLVVIVPEPRDRHHPDPDYVSQLWEERWMAVVDVILFWVPRNKDTMPGLNTNIEFGRNEATGRIVLGLPTTAVSVHYLRRAAETYGAPVCETLAATAQAALDRIGTGAQRTGSERDVPLLIWRTAGFQTWRTNDTRKLASARVLWAWAPGPSFRMLCWSMHVRFTEAEQVPGELLIAEPGASDLVARPLPSDAANHDFDEEASTE